VCYWCRGGRYQGTSYYFFFSSCSFFPNIWISRCLHRQQSFASSPSISLRVTILLIRVNTQSIPPGHLAVGVPARVIRRVTAPKESIPSAIGDRAVFCQSLAHVRPTQSPPSLPLGTKGSSWLEAVSQGATPNAQLKRSELVTLQEKVKLMKTIVLLLSILLMALIWQII
jgi:hypothetical protein